MERSYTLLVDSPCELPPAFCKEHDIDVLNFTYAEKSTDEDSLSGVDDMFETGSPKEFYNAMRAGAMPMTTQPSQHQYKEVFSRLLKRNKPIVYLCFDSALSGAYDGAMLVLEQMNAEAAHPLPIFIVDTKLASTPLNILCHDAALKRDSGMAPEELAAWAEDAHNYMYTYFMVDDLNVLARGGRLKKGTAMVGSALSIKPIVTIKLDGSLGLVGMCRGRKKGLKKLASYYFDLHNPEKNFVGIAGADCDEDVAELQRIITKEAQVTPEFLISLVGPVIGSHVGPAMISCCFWGERHKED